MEDFVEIRLWGEERMDFLRRFLPYERGLPSHDTVNDVINGLDADLFKACFASWVKRSGTAIPNHRHRWQDLAPQMAQAALSKRPIT